jgi:hypothetical protein
MKDFRVYIAGPMSGYLDYNFPAFHHVAAQLRERGMDVVNPAELNTDPDTNKASTDPYGVCLKRALAGLLTCDMLVLLDGWELSTGARLEEMIARTCNMPVMKIQTLLDAL